MTEQPNSEMFALARESRGLSQKDLAVRAGVTQPFISQLEAGDAKPSAASLDRVAQALAYRTNFFFYTDAIHGPGTACIYHRKRLTLPVTDYRRLLARLNITRIQIARLLRGIEIDASNTFPRMDIEEYGSPSYVARSVRAAWRLPHGPIKNLTAAVESAGGLVASVPFNARKIDAISQWLPELPPLFLVNADSPTDRMRYTLAHEIGHLVMHVAPSMNMEAEADEFAAEFLMPAREIAPHLRPLSIERLPELKLFWRVSMAALLRRAKGLRRISSTQYKRLFTQLSALGYRLNEPRPLPPEKPVLLRAIVDLHIKKHGHSVESLSKFVGLLPQEFAQQYREDSGGPFRLVT